MEKIQAEWVGTTPRLAFVKAMQTYRDTPTAANMGLIFDAAGALDGAERQRVLGSMLAVTEIQQEFHRRLFGWKRRLSNCVGGWLIHAVIRPTDPRYADYLLTRYALAADTVSLHALHVRALHSAFPPPLSEHARALLKSAARELPGAAADLDVIRLHCIGCAASRAI